MDSEMNPRVALDTAVATRQAATVHQMPAAFPVVAAVTFAAGMILIGASWLSADTGTGTGRVLGLSGAAVILVNVALWPSLVLRWRRSGIVPRIDGCQASSRRWRSFWLAVGALVISALVWPVTGRIGWAVVAAGILFGAETWYRLNGWRRR